MKKKRLLLGALLLIFVCFVTGASFTPYQELPSTSLTTYKVENIDKIFFPESEMNQLLITMRRDNLAHNQALRFHSTVPPDALNENHLGIILPHHLLAADAIRNAFQMISSFSPDIIVLMSPNHQANISAPVVTRSEPLQVLGKNYFMHPLVTHLVAENLAIKDRDMFLNEHGIYSLLPFIDDVDWDVPIIPLVFARNTHMSQIEELLVQLNSFLANKKVLWIASIDFSHYLPASTSRLKDMETMQWIESKNYSAIMSSTSDHLDAPAVLTLWLKKFDTITQLWHSNSAEIVGGAHHEEGTSYMIYLGH